VAVVALTTVELLELGALAVVAQDRAPIQLELTELLT
jgi:hypothetical protein